MGCYLSPWDIYEDKYGCFGDNNNKKNNHNKGSEKGTFTDYNKLYVAWINEICQAKKQMEAINMAIIIQNAVLTVL